MIITYKKKVFGVNIKCVGIILLQKNQIPNGIITYLT